MQSECIDHGCKGYGLGYATAWIKLPDGTKFSSTRHRRVHYERTGELPEVVRHKCDNPRCINPDHLEGGTYTDNVQDMFSRGRNVQGKVYRGEENVRSKLKYVDVQYIRSVYVKNSKEFGIPALARKFGVGISHVHRILKGAARETC